MSVYVRPHLLSSPLRLRYASTRSRRSQRRRRTGEEIAFVCFWFCGWMSGQFSRIKFSKERRTILPLPGERAGVGGCHPCIHDAVAASEKSGFMPCYPLKTARNLLQQKLFASFACFAVNILFGLRGPVFARLRPGEHRALPIYPLRLGVAWVCVKN